MKRRSVYLERALDEVLAVAGSIFTYDSMVGYLTVKTPIFNVELVDEVENVKITLGVLEKFDRWSNSRNFFTKRCKKKKCYYPLFLPQYNWAKQVLNSKLFDFNNYTYSIELPWLITGKNP